MNAGLVDSFVVFGRSISKSLIDLPHPLAQPSALFPPAHALLCPPTAANHGAPSSISGFASTDLVDAPSQMSVNLDHQLPFRVNQEAESKSFMIGYRSAWFRCKIKSMSFRKRQIGYFLEFYDYPDEKIRWTKLYQKRLQQPDQALEEGKLELMVRPPFPPFFRKSQQPKFCPTSDVIAITNDTWKVGDLVDWCYDSCYWSGRVSELLKDDHIKIDLPKPPIGEGNSYIAHCKDLRPSLDWTPENGWMLPVRKVLYIWISLSFELVKPVHLNELIRLNEFENKRRKEKKSSREVHFCSIEKLEETINTRMSMPCNSSLEGKPNCSYTATEELSDTSSVPTEASYTEDHASATDSVKNIHISGSDGVISTKDAVCFGRKQPSARDHLNSLGKIWIDETNYTASLKYPPDSIESSIIQLEVLAQKIKWLKGLQKFRFQWSSATKSSWNFVENNTFLK
ncbi:agenet domain containing protein [Musa troglodytarum]|uniref:Agenet domain containing protein n=1 Tax=Musa troglodytarum TaxID=320322 RepID=A0A9E7G2Q5_9LILI|nr:agenet domain containing protein [Musa troglodytarum]